MNKEEVMILEAKPFEGMKQFNFYTFDVKGRDCVITVFAENQDLAWEKFYWIYGKERPVDFVEEV